MTVVAADGNNVQPVRVDEFRIAVAETYDVIVKPEEDIAYSIFAASMAKSAFGRATLAPHEGMQANIPIMGDKPSLTMADMGMDHGNMDMPMKGMDHSKMKMVDGKMDHSKMKMVDGKMDHSKMTMGNSKVDPFYAAGSGLTPKADNEGKFLSY